ncbi:MAG: hypothetical protein LUC32_02915 [Clostridiales bacterium]|nr:hypothetical protein [Clostridiales bacterium]
MKKSKMSAILFEIAALFWFINAVVSKDWMFLPIGLCFVALGIVYVRDKEGE